MAEEKTILLSTAYLPNIQYVSKFFLGYRVLLEKYETYPKQSFRNRSVIFGANGPLDLVIPVKRPKGNHTESRDILLDYDTPWRAIHWKAIQSAYKNSPFFEIFEPEMRAWYKRKMKFLIDWNTYLLGELFKLTGKQVNIAFTESYFPKSSEGILDFRDSIHPKLRMQEADELFSAPEYYQVFAGKHKFYPNLSYIDLVFNEGPQAVFLCRNSVRSDHWNKMI
jgi:hypothetical protein